MFCTTCGTQIPDGNRFCTNCGAPVNSAPAPAPFAAAPVNNGFAAPSASVAENAPVINAAPSAAEYEYKVVNGIMTSDLESKLNEYAAEGWRTVCADFSGLTASIVLERKK